MAERDENINVRTTVKAKQEFLKQLQSHSKSQTYVVNLLIDAFIAQPIECVCALERMKGSRKWQ